AIKSDFHFKSCLGCVDAMRLQLHWLESPLTLMGTLDIVKEYESQEIVPLQVTEMDWLTQIPNRYWFNRELDSLLSNTKNNEKHALLYINLDNFKQVNEMFGHTTGDEILKNVVIRLKEALMEKNVVSRLGGDEFVIFLKNISSENEAAQSALNVLALFEKPFYYNDIEVMITPSMGLAFYPDLAMNKDDLLCQANMAMTHAKKHGRNNFQFYNPVMKQQTQVRAQIEKELRKALINKEFNVYYQPKIHVYSGNIVGMEALIRWDSPTRGLIYPKDFIPVAEETGLIQSITDYVMLQACQDTKRWVDTKNFDGMIAVNISAKQFYQMDLTSRIEGILDETQLSPRYLELEITESAVVQDVESAVTIMSQLRKQGIHLTIDDFGTGYSSLSYLKRFPLNAMKLDMSFIRDISASTSGRNIVSAIINMAHLLGLSVVAEGVETEEQRSILSALHCDIMQGYFHSEALCAEDFEKLLMSEKELLKTG
ncbi:MAG: bifunctional diguanylate cyclase/phosphodiesterase, partial [Pseudomonadota bacterium]